jgi:hypothetical protein
MGQHQYSISGIISPSAFTPGSMEALTPTPTHTSHTDLMCLLVLAAHCARLFVLLVEVEWAAADLVELLTDTLPPLLSAAATSLEEAAAAADQQQQQHQKQQQQDQQTFVGQLADMLYSLAVLAGSSRDASSELLHGSNGSSGGDSAGGSSSSSSSSGDSPQACWYQFDGMQRLLDAVAVTGSNWDMDCVSRKVGC